MEKKTTSTVADRRLIYQGRVNLEWNNMNNQKSAQLNLTVDIPITR